MQSIIQREDGAQIYEVLIIKSFAMGNATT